MSLENLVKVTIFLSDRRHRAANAKIRHEVLGEHRPALTIIITGIYDEAWLLEIEGQQLLRAHCCWLSWDGKNTNRCCTHS